MKTFNPLTVNSGILSFAQVMARIKVFIHGGMHKTGTTSIQAFLNQSKKALLDHGVLVASEPNSGLSQCLDVRLGSWTPYLIQGYLEAAKAKKCKAVIFSHEVVSIFSESQFKTLTSCFDDYDLTYVFCFRHWTSFLFSRWSQNCIRRDSQTFSEYLDELQKEGLNHVDWQHQLVIERALNSGRCCLNAVSFDNALKQTGGVLGAILKACGVEHGPSINKNNQLLILNQGVDQTVRELCRLFNGVIANKLGYPQNELFHSIHKAKICNIFFDLETRIKVLEASLIGRFERRINEYIEHLELKPDIFETNLVSLERYLKYFTNAIDNKIYWQVEAQSTLSFSGLNWSGFEDQDSESINTAARLLMPN